MLTVLQQIEMIDFLMNDKLLHIHLQIHLMMHINAKIKEPLFLSCYKIILLLVNRITIQAIAVFANMEHHI